MLDTQALLFDYFHMGSAPAQDACFDALLAKPSGGSAGDAAAAAAGAQQQQGASDVAPAAPIDDPGTLLEVASKVVFFPKSATGGGWEAHAQRARREVSCRLLAAMGAATIAAAEALRAALPEHTADVVAGEVLEALNLLSPPPPAAVGGEGGRRGQATRQGLAAV